ncbi:pre-rRNA-processing protein esf1, partial [Ceratobasidium sp. UAMH 11750]
DGDDYDDDALRQYQLDRLRYYYAIITCNSPSTASHIYNELEGTELERSANVFDLSYVPADMEFAQECRDECTSDAQASHKGMDFVTDALRHSKVKLTWDDDDPERAKLTRRRMTRKEVDEGDFHALLASSSSEDEDENEEGEPATSKRERMRALLLGGNDDDLPEGWGDDGDDDKGAGLEITFMPALSSSAPKEAEEETTLDRYKRKQKEKKAQRKAKREQGPSEPSGDAGNDFFGEDDDVDAKVEPAGATKRPKSGKEDMGTKAPRKAPTGAELALLLAPDATADAEPKHFDMRAVLKAEKAGRSGKKGRSKKGAPEANAEDGQDFEMDVKDERFAALHEDYEFAIDPSNPHFKKTKSMQALLDERAKRQRERQGKEDARARERSKVAQEGVQDRSLKSIVESVKRKSGVAQPSLGKRRRM